MVALRDLEAKIHEASDNREAGINAFLAQNEGEGWLLPETIRLADYDLGHDDRALQPQDVAVRLGPRFYDRQLAQSGEESMRECHLHARNILGDSEYTRLLNRVNGQQGPGDVGDDGLLSTDPASEFIPPDSIVVPLSRAALRAPVPKPGLLSCARRPAASD